MTIHNVRQVKGRKTGLFVVDNLFVDMVARHCKHSCISVYISICRHADNKTQTCFPSEGLIAEENGIGKSTVKKAIKKLEKLGLISVFRSRRKNGTRNVNIYTLLDVRGCGYSSEVNQAVVIKPSLPQVIKSINHSQELTYKDTQNNKDTKNKDVLKEQRENSENSNSKEREKDVVSFSDYFRTNPVDILKGRIHCQSTEAHSNE